MTDGTLEGLESCWGSPGLGMRFGKAQRPPTVGERFLLMTPHIRDMVETGTVTTVKLLSDGKIGFKTSRSTYVWTPDQSAEKGRRGTA